MDVYYTRHLKLRLSLRKIPKEYPNEVYHNPERKFYDNTEEKYIAIKKLYYNGKTRNMMIAYEKKQDKIEIVTIHPISEEKINSRKANKRWTENE